MNVRARVHGTQDIKDFVLIDSVLCYRCTHLMFLFFATIVLSWIFLEGIHSYCAHHRADKGKNKFNSPKMNFPLNKRRHVGPANLSDSPSPKYFSTDLPGIHAVFLRCPAPLVFPRFQAALQIR